MEILSFEEVRIIGSLIEKENNTPEYYPLTINSLTNACNQKSSRNPVVSFDESLVEQTVRELREKKLVSKLTGSDVRVPKYSQKFTEYYNLSTPQVAVLCVLFLRGAQTIGEIKGRCHRIYEFESLADTENVIEELIMIPSGPFVVKLPKDSGRENRFMHLFCGEPEISVLPQSKSFNIEERVTELEQEVSTLQKLLTSLRAEFDEFKNQF
ncbi:MAG: YceH family protein [Melioribacteraceae bacterium]|nr:YceH family protein [Melioribacteraceae bacterium]MCF8265122.1 YceH family protein [Melioribacteraceae bacterium]MCF8413595.1 YceH family protein [Melioribacteraceae bacterium]